MNKPMSVDEEIHQRNLDEEKYYPKGIWFYSWMKEMNRKSEALVKYVRENLHPLYLLMNLIAKNAMVRDDLDSRRGHYRRIRQDHRMSDLRDSLCDHSWDI